MEVVKFAFTVAGWVFLAFVEAAAAAAGVLLVVVGFLGTAGAVRLVSNAVDKALERRRLAKLSREIKRAVEADAASLPNADAA